MCIYTYMHYIYNMYTTSYRGTALGHLLCLQLVMIRMPITIVYIHITCVYVCVYIYIYMYIHMCVYVPSYNQLYYNILWYVLYYRSEGFPLMRMLSRL